MNPSSHSPQQARDGHWVFGYGSLIYKVDFPYRQREVASIEGYARRFWQGSHDHRGTPDAPGRVLTLVPEPDHVCLGMAYLVDGEVFAHLDHREKNGYERRQVSIRLRESDLSVAGTVYFAGQDNPAWLGPADASEIARHIGRSRGPSGSNRDYLLKLARALRELGAEDSHVFELEQYLLQSAGH
ncbi:gamma-glutamylcyclotransferase [Wenzhouxiangella sp. XN201]|uniref:gamma-glutamylcyclotransferase n=1 Tax=Wenzhouxiangella sp. XN201 TaxID=2710755 RepID=UPI0013C8ADEE|nr:gamma-glutamylcyclotransferase [Wenzhouxiangella sp. XN201]NEZ04999.1 gamma-glutamylcyclotransferase [Wenzhouxiangella sp. XN201]